MLAFIVTDAPDTAGELQEELEHAARSSFNAITVDGDQSTSDMAVLISSAERPPAHRMSDTPTGPVWEKGLSGRDGIGQALYCGHEDLRGVVVRA